MEYFSSPQNGVDQGITLRDLIAVPREVRGLLTKFANGHEPTEDEASVFEQPKVVDPLIAAAIHVEMQLLRQAMGPKIDLPDGYQQKLHAGLKSLNFSGMLEDRPPKKERKNDFAYRARVSEEYRYQPNSTKPQMMSRSRIDLFFDCQRCFYIRQRGGLKLPEGFSPKLNIALDILLKREFDFFRELGLAHPIMLRHGLNGVPLKSPHMTKWRDAFRGGLKAVHGPTNLLVTAAPDDIWIIDGKAAIVDYKSTFTEHVLNLEDEWKKIYKRQVELNAWLLAQDSDFSPLGIPTGEAAYFVYANARVKNPLFLQQLPFETEVFSHQLDFSWIEPTLEKIKEVLESDTPPRVNECCEECSRREGYREFLQENAVNAAAKRNSIEEIQDGVRRGLSARLNRHLAAETKRFLDEQMSKWKSPQKKEQQDLFPASSEGPDVT